MLLGIADICLLGHLNLGMTRGEFIRKAAELGAQTASLRLTGEEGEEDYPAIAAEAGIELEFRTGGTDPETLGALLERAHGFGATFLRTIVSGKYHYNDPDKQAQMVATASGISRRLCRY